jgi:hypothetical protein
VFLVYGEYDPDVVLADTGHLRMLKSPDAFDRVLFNLIYSLPTVLPETES